MWTSKIEPPLAMIFCWVQQLDKTSVVLVIDFREHLARKPYFTLHGDT